MGLLDLFRRGAASTRVDVPETRSSGTGYTAQIIAARDSYITGTTGLGELTAAVQASVSLWEAGFAMADVRGTDMLSRRIMALLARSLALRGESVFLIRDGLVPVADWDLSTRDGIPRAYRLSLSEAGGGRTETALAAEVLHVRLASDAVSPWSGQSPLHRSSLTASLLYALETALRDVYRDAPLGSQIVPLPDGKPDEMATMRAAFRGRHGSVLVVEGVAQATAAGLNPQLGQRREDLSPDLAQTMAAESVEAARDAIFAAFGVLPGLHNRSTTGPMVREAQRHLATWTLQPLAELVAEEMTAKLGATVSIDTLRPLQAYDLGGRARALSAIVSSIAEAKAAGLTPAEMNAALTLVNWGDGDKAA